MSPMFKLNTFYGSGSDQIIEGLRDEEYLEIKIKDRACCCWDYPIRWKLIKHKEGA